MTKSTKLKSITLLGSSSGNNAGDAALMTGIMDAIDRELGQRILYEIPSVKPNFVWHNYDNKVRPIGMMPWNLSIKMLGIPTLLSILRTDLTLVFDAVLFDRSLYNPLFNYMSSIYLLFKLARRCGKRYALFNVGIGPVTSEMGQGMLKEICEGAEFITVREKGSLELLERLGIRNANTKLTADSAITAKHAGTERADEILQSLGLDPARDILALNVNRYLNTWSGTKGPKLSEDEFLGIYSAGVNRFLQKYPVQCLIVGTQHHDEGISRRLLSMLNARSAKACVVNNTISHYEVKAVLSRVSLLFGMRLHALILASSALASICSLRYQPKVGYYLDVLGLSDYDLSFDDFNVDAIANHLDKAWNARHEIKSRLENVIPALGYASDEPARMLRDL